MPWRLIGFILIFGIFLAFVAFNLGNRCDINFGFKTFSDVPVFFTVFTSFALGMLCSLPFMLRSRLKKKNKPIDSSTQKPKKQWGKKKESPAEPEELSFSDGGPYGVN